MSKEVNIVTRLRERCTQVTLRCKKATKLSKRCTTVPVRAQSSGRRKLKEHDSGKTMFKIKIIH